MRIFIFSQKVFLKNPGYSFKSEHQTYCWPKEDGKGLGAAGIWNFLLRLGIKSHLVDSEKLHIPIDGDLLYIVAEAIFSLEEQQLLQNWMKSGGKIIASGTPEAWHFAFPQSTIITGVRFGNPYSALGWKMEHSKIEVMAPPKWTYMCLQRDEEEDALTTIDQLVAIGGERQTPERALIIPLKDAPAIIRFNNFCYLNGNPFAAFQSWLQGQEDLSPWLQWRHRLYWLDEFVVFLAENLKKIGVLPISSQNISGLGKTTVVLRHDLDYSRDTTYLNLEDRENVPGVHALLRDSNTKFWLKELEGKAGHESAFHYNTARYSRVIEAIRSKVFKLPKRTYRPNRKAICKTGLLKQIRWAKRKGIGIQTLHRHLGFIFYPELIDALDIVYEGEPEVLGSSSLFRGQQLRWGANCSDGTSSTYGVFPDPQFPLWFPFKLAHGADGGRMLRGWEMTCMMESEPGLIEQMLEYEVQGLPQRIIVLNYHPAHAKGSTFAKHGCEQWFQEILALCKKYGAEIKTLSEVYKILNNFLETNDEH